MEVVEFSCALSRNESNFSVLMALEGAEQVLDGVWQKSERLRRASEESRSGGGMGMVL